MADFIEQSFFEKFKFNPNVVYHFGKTGTPIKWASDQFKNRSNF